MGYKELCIKTPRVLTAVREYPNKGSAPVRMFVEAGGANKISSVLL